MKSVIFTLVCIIFTIQVSAATPDYKMMSYDELLAIDVSTLDKENKKAYKKAFKDVKKNHELYGEYLTDGRIKINRVGQAKGASASSLYQAARNYLANPNNLYIRSAKYQKGMFASMTGGGQDPSKKEFVQFEKDYKENARILSDNKNSSIASNLVIMYQSNTVMSPVRTLFFNTELIIQFKDGRYRIQTGQIKWEHWNNHTSEPQPIYGTKSAKAMGCGDRNTMAMLLKCNKGRKGIKKAVDFYMASLNETLSNIEEKLNHIQEDEDW